MYIVFMCFQSSGSYCCAYSYRYVARILLVIVLTEEWIVLLCLLLQICCSDSVGYCSYRGVAHIVLLTLTDMLLGFCWLLFLQRSDSYCFAYSYRYVARILLVIVLTEEWLILLCLLLQMCCSDSVGYCSYRGVAHIIVLTLTDMLLGFCWLLFLQRSGSYCFAYSYRYVARILLVIVLTEEWLILFCLVIGSIIII